MDTELRCRIGLHRWQETWDGDEDQKVKVCRLCGARRRKGWPAIIGNIGGSGGVG